MHAYMLKYIKVYVTEMHTCKVRNKYDIKLD